MTSGHWDEVRAQCPSPLVELLSCTTASELLYQCAITLTRFCLHGACHSPVDSCDATLSSCGRAPVVLPQSSSRGRRSSPRPGGAVDGVCPSAAELPLLWGRRKGHSTAASCALPTANTILSFQPAMSTKLCTSSAVLIGSTSTHENINHVCTCHLIHGVFSVFQFLHS
jgi:hypothetical protein